MVVKYFLVVDLIFVSLHFQAFVGENISEEDLICLMNMLCKYFAK